jgi:hypothetical protein
MATYSTTNAPLPWMEGYLQDYMGRAQDVANQPYQQGPGTYTGPNDLLTQGWQATVNRAQQGSPVMGAATGQLTNTINGGGLGRQATMNPYADAANPYASMDNPYLTQNVQNAQGDLTSAYNNVNVPQWAKAMSSSGSFGNSGVSEYAAMDASNLQKNLGRVSTDLRGAAYNTAANLAENQAARKYGAGQQFAGSQDAITSQERGLQQSAMGMAPTFANQDYTDITQLLNAGTQAQGYDQAAQNQQQQWWQDARNYPQQQNANYGAALGVGSGGTSTQTTPDPSQASQLIGGGMTGLALYNLLFGSKP